MKGKQLGAAAVASLVALEHIHLDQKSNLITRGSKWGSAGSIATPVEFIPKSDGADGVGGASREAASSPAAALFFPSLGAETAFEFNAARVVLAKDTSAHERKNKCERCWKTVNLCLCTKVQELMASSEGELWRRSGQPRWRFLVYMSREEWRCGGNSGRLLLNLFPAETSFYVHGVRKDAERLRAALLNCYDGNPCPACVLFPGSDALTVPLWLASTSSWGGNSRGSFGNSQRPRRSDGSSSSRNGASSTNRSSSSSNDDDADASSGGDSSASGSSDARSGFMTVVLVDGTWRQARRMAKHLKSVLLPGVPQVTLTLEGPNRLSVFRRKQSAEGRVCTSEALSLFLGEAIAATAASPSSPAAESGVEDVDTSVVLSSTSTPISATVEACYTIVQRAVQLNNSALDPTRTVLWVGNGLTPDW